MRRVGVFVIVLVVVSGLAGCKSGDNTPTCSFDDPATLAPSAWPKFRHDLQNTGTVLNASVANNRGQLRWMFPASSSPPKGAFAASPVLNGSATDPASATRIYIGSTDAQIYAVNPATGEQDTTFLGGTGSSITSTALVAIRDGKDALFVGGGDGNMYGVDPSGVPLLTNWPSPAGGFVSASASIGATDGTVYDSSLTGVFFGNCPNGVARFVLSVPGVQSSAAIGLDGTVYFGADDQQLRAVVPFANEANASVKWSFSTTGPILTAPVVDPSDGSIYVADTGGRVLKARSDGTPDPTFKFTNLTGGDAVGPIHSSPALVGSPVNHLYFGSDDGTIYAADTQTGAVDWSFPTDAEIGSSPAVATGAAQPIVVIGSNDGNVYFIQDNGSAPTPLAVFTIGAPVRSSPAIGSDGTIYIGADDGRLYAIQ